MICVIIPVYQYTHISALCHDILREKNIAEILIVDNGGRWTEDWERANSGIEYLTPSYNLGWIGGLNHGLTYAGGKSFRHHGYYEGYLLLNDDTRLSNGFIAGLRDASNLELRRSLVGPMYDDVWPHQKCKFNGFANKYKPKAVDREVSFIDGTAMYIPDSLFSKIGYLDDEYFAKTGWGGDFDYCLRARKMGHKVIATERSYLNHLRGATAKNIFKDYEGEAGVELNTGMTAKYGPNWKEKLGI